MWYYIHGRKTAPFFRKLSGYGENTLLIQRVFSFFTVCDIDYTGFPCYYICRPYRPLRFMFIVLGNTLCQMAGSVAVCGSI